jgi:hypothetical protein
MAEIVFSGWVGALVLAIIGGDEKRGDLICLTFSLFPIAALVVGLIELFTP